MHSEARKHLVIFILIAIIAGLGLSSFFYFLASYHKHILNGIAVLVFMALLFRSFYSKWPRRMEEPWWKKFILTVPLYFHILNAVSFFLLLLPKLIKKPEAGLVILTGLSFIVLLLWVLKKTMNGKMKKNA